ncbi:MAG: hypothetical protein VW683_14680, partial [Betaproteobacteria bacterium]
ERRVNRKLRRSLSKQTGSDSAEKMSQQVALFSKLPEQCSACAEPFDKKNKEMVNEWNVVVRQEVVRLFCPHCIAKAKEAIENERG